MRYLLQVFIFLLPLHAVLITYLSCKLGINTDIIRFWKEIVIVFLLALVSIKVLIVNKFNIKEIYKNNYLLGTITAFSICSFIYIFFPYFNIKLSSILGFKYDVFFLFAMIIGVYLGSVRENFETLLKTLFISIGLILVVFLPWYAFGDISKMAEVFGYSSQVSTYNAGGCIAFAQNVTGGHHRFQGTFGDPIRFSVFLSVFYFIYLGYILHKEFNNKIKLLLLTIIPSIIVIISIFFAFTKTSILGLLFGSVLFIYLTSKIKYKKELSKRFLISLAGILGVAGVVILYVKRNLFLHPEAVLGRVENLITSVNMFFYNPFGYGLGIAGPASQLGTSSNEALAQTTRKFLPENWYVQILLEQSFVGLALFISILFIIGNELWKIVKIKRDFLSIGIFVSYITILFMANFTHIFEEAATSFTLFLIMGAYIVKESREYKKIIP